MVVYFNSIKVRLELPGGSVDTSSGQVFQFHKGTIRTALPVQAPGVLAEFQFHKGTIRTQPTY